MSKAATAILVKSRAKYGRRLTASDYDSLLGCKSVADIASYLRNSTHYNVSLEGIKEASLHRRNLEQLLRSKIYEDFAELCRFESSIGEHYFEYLTLKTEIDYFINFMRYFIAGHPEQFIILRGGFFAEHSKIDFLHLTEAKTPSDILAQLKNTPYHKLLSPFLSDDSKIDFTMIEAQLDRYLYHKTQAMIEKRFSGDEKVQLQNLFAEDAELEDIRRIIRAKKYYHVSDDVLRSQLIGIPRYLSRRQLVGLIECEDEEQIMNLLKKTAYRHVLGRLDFSYIDELAQRIKFDFCRKAMCYSPHAAVVMASTITTFEIEVENITNIIEGKRYGVENDTIKKMLILERTV